MSAAAEGSSSEEDSDVDDNNNLLAGSFLRTFGESQSSLFACTEPTINSIRKTLGRVNYVYMYTLHITSVEDDSGEGTFTVEQSSVESVLRRHLHCYFPTFLNNTLN
jgi:hypothetical protein